MGITANELRIGNLVMVKTSNDAGIYQVYRVGGWFRNWGKPDKKGERAFTDEQLIMIIGGARDKEELPESKLRPIPLTPEILNNIDWGGYKKLYINSYFSIGDVGHLYYCNDYTGININYLHQFQNLFFALTGQELIYNPIKQTT